MNKLITTVAALLLAVCAVSPSGAATQHARAESPAQAHADAKADAKADSKADAKTAKAAEVTRYKRIRAKAHRNAARAKAHARALRLADQTQ